MRKFRVNACDPRFQENNRVHYISLFFLFIVKERKSHNLESANKCLIHFDYLKSKLSQSQTESAHFSKF